MAGEELLRGCCTKRLQLEQPIKTVTSKAAENIFTSLFDYGSLRTLLNRVTCAELSLRQVDRGWTYLVLERAHEGYMPTLPIQGSGDLRHTSPSIAKIGTLLEVHHLLTKLSEAILGTKDEGIQCKTIFSGSNSITRNANLATSIRPEHTIFLGTLPLIPL